MKLDTYWLPSTIFPGTVGYVPSAEAWAKVMRHLNCDDPYPTAPAMVTSFEYTKLGALTILVTFSDGVFKLSTPGVAGIVAHEVSHVVDYILEFAGEDTPGSETKAYMQQHYVLELMHAVLTENQKRETST